MKRWSDGGCAGFVEQPVGNVIEQPGRSGFALNARPHRDKPASPHPLETWEGEGGQLAAAPGTARERDYATLGG
jgi:hypothetical protein